jgi:ubiquitin carboxyl-terminal hydrolase 36/42
MSEFAGKGINGLYNANNTCYINTSVQCLGHCVRLLRYVLYGKYERRTGCLVNELREVLHALWVEDHGLIPNRFLKYLRMHLTQLDMRHQNDIQEFLVMLMDKMNASISVPVPVPVPESVCDTENTTSIGRLQRKADCAWQTSMGKEYSPLTPFFYGQSINQIICGRCQKIHHNYEPFSVLMLAIPDKESSLTECLGSHVSEEYLNDGEQEWRCDGCNHTEKSLKTTKFWRLPHLLTICLKRFTHDLRKNNAYITIPETLDVSQYVIGPTHKTYNLVSVACHVGVYGGGHYYAVCKNPNGKWYKIDDKDKTELGHEFQTPANAYMVFYEAATAED